MDVTYGDRTLMDYHHAIRHVYPDKLLMISGETLDDLEVIDQETGELFDWDHELVAASGQEVENELNLKLIRRKRDMLLAETDWVSSKYYDLGQPVPEEWTTYRQALRDLPANTTNPANPTWPTKPE